MDFRATFRNGLEPENLSDRCEADRRSASPMAAMVLVLIRRLNHVRVLLADGHARVRWALRTVIKEESGLIIVGEVSEADEILSQAKALRPDLVILEWELPGQRGVTLVPALRTLDFQPRVIVLSRKPEARGTALAAGADAFVSKADAPDLLLSVLRRLGNCHRDGATESLV